MESQLCNGTVPVLFVTSSEPKYKSSHDTPLADRTPCDKFGPRATLITLNKMSSRPNQLYMYMYTNWLDDDTNAEDKIKKWRPILAWNRGSHSAASC